MRTHTWTQVGFYITHFYSWTGGRLCNPFSLANLVSDYIWSHGSGVPGFLKRRWAAHLEGWGWRFHHTGFYVNIALTDLEGRPQRAHPPRPKMFAISCSFFGNFGKIMLAPPPDGWHPLPLRYFPRRSNQTNQLFLEDIIY